MSADMKAKLSLDASGFKAESAAVRADMDKTGEAIKQNLGEAGKQATASAKAMKEGLAGAGEKAGVVERIGTSVGRTFLGTAAAVGAVRVAMGATAVALASTHQQMANLRGDAEGVLKAQLASDDAVGNMVAGIPLIGSSIKSAMDTFGDRAGIEKSIANIQEVKQAILGMEQYSRKLSRETALEKARLSGASEGDMLRMNLAYRAEDQKDDLEKMRAARTKAVQELADQEERVRQANERRGKWYNNTGGLGEKWAKENQDNQNAPLADLRATAARADRDFQRAKADMEASQAQGKASAAAKDAELVAKGIEEKRKAAEEEKRIGQQITKFTADETQNRINQVDQEYEELRASAEQHGWDITALTRSRNEKVAAIEKDAADKRQAESTRALDQELSAWKTQADKKLDAARQLQDKLKGIERGRAGAEESWYDTNLRLDMQGKSEAQQKRMAQAAAGRYLGQARTAGGKGDREEERRLLEKSMGMAEQAGNRKMMADIMAEIRKSWEAQRAETKKNLDSAKGELKDLATSLGEIEKRASSIKVELDTAEAKARLAELGIRPVQATVSIKPTDAKGFAAGGPVGTDTIPAWLTPGEFVVNRAASQANRGLLEAINNGLTLPSPNARRFALGGAVGASAASYDQRQYNIHLGGQAPSARRQARELLGEIRRQEGRGR